MSRTFNGVKVPTTNKELRAMAARVLTVCIVKLREGRELTRKREMYALGTALNKMTERERRAFMFDLTYTLDRKVWAKVCRTGKIGRARIFANHVARASRAIEQNRPYKPIGDAKIAQDWLIARLNTI